MRLFTLTLLLFTSTTIAAFAETARIAAATNFAETARSLAEAFNAATGHDVEVIPGATGKLFAQVAAGAPYDAFLSADTETVDRLIEAGLAPDGHRQTYAIGALVLWSGRSGLSLADPGAALRQARHVAIANPALAPYGRAAMKALRSLGLQEAVAPKLVTGENVGQAFALVETGAADLGFVAASSLVGRTGAADSYWRVPDDAHDPILQDAVLLSHGADNAAALGFLDYLRSDEARRSIGAAGYGVAP
ncbi:MAG: molybdate ABC transporter substrate-binding protein [Rhodobacteraceae bacterium]|nr:molybdate ABC transporter substrate-binding protein [Paracoccaceae bacterium]